jgi:two-component system, NtrC family, nitrogen regulation response regulator GlnG
MNAAASSKKILIADDDSSIRLVLSQAFSRLGYQVRATGNATTLLKWVSDGEGDLVVTDVVMPDENVFDVLPRIRKERPKLPVIVMSAQNTLLTAVNAAEVGAFDYVAKPFDLDDMTSVARRALSRPVDSEASKAQARAMRDERLPLIGRSGPMQEVYRTVARLVGADLTVLILGESGTGKELVARALHDMGRRKDGKFVVINLAAVPRERVEAELFGREDGDYGKLVEADGGTLFLDEIGDMPLDAQTRLLRVIDGSEQALNPRTGRRPNVRIIAATNRDLRALIQQGLFREDLYFRAPAPAAAARPGGRHPRSRPDLPAAGQPRGPAGQDHRRRRPGAAQAARLARQCARAGEPDPPHLRPLCGGTDHRPHRRAGTGRPAACGSRPGRPGDPGHPRGAAPFGLFRRTAGGRPAAGPLRPGAGGGGASADPAHPGRDPRQSGAGG